MIPLARVDIGREEIEAVVEVLESGWLASGKRVARFEESFAAATGSGYAVAVGSGTAALHLGLMAMGVGPGHEVIVPSFTFAASANSIVMCGAEPVFVDVDPADFTMHADLVEPLIDSRTRAIMPVHVYGQMAPMAEITAMAERFEIGVIEDAAQAHLAESEGTKAGAWGRVGAFSFYPTKNMTTGEGGMITTSDEKVAETARRLRNQGMTERYVHKIVGLNERMTEIEAAIGEIQLRRLPGWTARRREIAGVYLDRLNPALGLPVERPDAMHVFHQFTLAPPDRAPVQAALAEAGIGHDVHYPRGSHHQAPYRHRRRPLPITEDLAQRVISIPVRPTLTDDEIGHIVATLNSVDLG